MKIIFHHLNIFLATLLLPLAFTSCMNDGVTTSGSAQPEFSTDTLSLGMMWAGEPSPTAMMRIYNRQSKGIILSRVAVARCSGGDLHLNLDGVGGNEFHDVEIRANDSLFLLAEAVPSPDFSASIEITANGMTHTIPVSGRAIAPIVLDNLTVSRDFTIPAGSQVRVSGTVTISQGATLTIGEGTTIYFRDGAGIESEGQVIALGNPGSEVTLRGDRLSNVVPSIPFDVIPGQWEGIRFGSSSVGSHLSCVSVVNTCSGISLAPEAELRLTDCRISNSRTTIISGKDATLTAIGCEFSNACASLLTLDGGTTTLSRCTLSNHYLFSFPSGAAISLSGDPALNVTESIIHGDGAPLSASNSLPANVRFTRCLFGSKGSDDTNFIDCIWETDPLFMLDIDNYVMDFRLSPDSPARGKATEPHTDRLGITGTALGAYN